MIDYYEIYEKLLIDNAMAITKLISLQGLIDIMCDDSTHFSSSTTYLEYYLLNNVKLFCIASLFLIIRSKVNALHHSGIHGHLWWDNEIILHNNSEILPYINYYNHFFFIRRLHLEGRRSACMSSRDMRVRNILFGDRLNHL